VAVKAQLRSAAAIERPHLTKVLSTESAAKAQRKVLGELRDQGLTIGGALSPTLLELHNAPANLPICL
jgi:hypothetical protein